MSFGVAQTVDNFRGKGALSNHLKQEMQNRPLADVPLLIAGFAAEPPARSATVTTSTNAKTTCSMAFGKPNAVDSAPWGRHHLNKAQNPSSSPQNVKQRGTGGKDLKPDRPPSSRCQRLGHQPPMTKVRRYPKTHLSTSRMGTRRCIRLYSLSFSSEAITPRLSPMAPKTISCGSQRHAGSYRPANSRST